MVGGLLAAPGPALGRTDPTDAREAMDRMETLRTAAPRPWSTLTIRPPPKAFGQFDESFAVEWNSAWTLPEEFVPALNEQAADGPRRSFSDLRWSAIPGFRPDAEADVRWYWAPEGPLVSTGSVRPPLPLDRPSPSARHLEGSLCAVIANLVSEASGLTAHCIVRRTTDPAVTLEVPSGEPLHVSFARVIALAGDARAVRIFPLAAREWSRRIPARLAIVVRSGAPRKPFTCTQRTTPAELLDAIEDERLYWPLQGFDKLASKGCPTVADLRATLIAIGNDRCAARELLPHVFDRPKRPVTAWRPHLARVLRIRAGHPPATQAARATLRLWATPGFLSGMDGLKPKVRAALDELQRACAQALPEAFPEDAFPGDLEDLTEAQEVGDCRHGDPGPSDPFNHRVRF